MKKVQIEFDELPFPTLERFGLTREMIEDLPMRVLDDICDGRHSPVLPVRVTDEHGGQIESRSRFAFIRMDNGQVDVVFYPALKSSPLERYDEAQQKQLLDGKAIVADVEMADGRSSKAFVQIDTDETGDVCPHAHHRTQPESAGRGHAPRCGGGKRDAARRAADGRRGRRVCYSGHRPSCQDRHPLLFGRRAAMAQPAQARVGQIHLRVLRLLDHGR